MALVFTSARERRLWVWTALVVAAIYSTLGLARTLAEEFRRRDILDAIFVVAFVAILLAIAAVGLKARPGGLEIGIALGVVAVYVLVFVRMAIPEERTHVIEYGVVAILLHEALTERRRHRAGVWSPTVIALGLTVALGAFDELIQLFLPSRVFDFRDVFTNASAALLAVLAKISVSWAGRHRQHRPVAQR